MIEYVDPKRAKLIEVLNSAIENEGSFYRGGGGPYVQQYDGGDWLIDGDINIGRIADFIMNAYGYTLL